MVTDMGQIDRGGVRDSSEASAQGWRPRVLFVSPRPPPIGGIATWTEDTLASDLATDHELSVFDTAWNESAVRPNSRWQFGRAVEAVRQIWRLRRRLRDQRPDIVHVSSSYHWGFLRDALFLDLARAHGAATVLHLHGGDFLPFLERLPRGLRCIARSALIRVGRVIVLDRATEAGLQALLGPRQVARIVNAVTVPVIPARRAPTAPVRIIFAGALLRAKGVLELLEAAEGLRGALVELIGPAGEEIRSQLERQRAVCEGSAVLVGELPRAGVLARLASGHVFVLPSHREGLPMVLLEAMAAGCAIVTTPVGGIPDVLRDGIDARFVTVGDVAGLRRTLQELIDRPDERERLGRAAHARAKDQHSLAATSRRLAEFYRTLLAERVRTSLRPAPHSKP